MQEKFLKGFGEHSRGSHYRAGDAESDRSEVEEYMTLLAADPNQREMFGKAISRLFFL